MAAGNNHFNPQPFTSLLKGTLRRGSRKLFGYRRFPVEHKGVLPVAIHRLRHFTGVDLFPRFIDIFNANSRRSNLQNRVTGVVGSMDSLSFQKEELDLIWSEGAIYNIWFYRGLNEWRASLKNGGFVS